MLVIWYIHITKTEYLVCDCRRPVQNFFQFCTCVCVCGGETDCSIRVLCAPGGSPRESCVILKCATNHHITSTNVRGHAFPVLPTIRSRRSTSFDEFPVREIKSRVAAPYIFRWHSSTYAHQSLLIEYKLRINPVSKWKASTHATGCIYLVVNNKHSSLIYCSTL